MGLVPGRKPKMQQLNGKTGAVETELEGGERIFSKGDTKSIIQQATAAQDEAALEKLGAFVVSAIRQQDSRKPEMTTT